MNREWWLDGPTWPIIEVEASPTNSAAPDGAAGDTFIFRPIVDGEPHPLPGLGQNEALLRYYDTA